MADVSIGLDERYVAWRLHDGTELAVHVCLVMDPVERSVITAMENAPALPLWPRHHPTCPFDSTDQQFKEPPHMRSFDAPEQGG